jgi:hypothetical protein
MIDSVLIQNGGHSAADLDGGVVVLGLRAGYCFGFNRVASEIWHMLAEPRRVGEILDSLSERHDVDRATLVRDVTPFLQTLVAYRLVRVIDPDEES